MNYREQAEKIYNQTRPDPRIVAIMGESSLTPVQRASLEDIENYLRMVGEAAQEYGVNLNPSKIEFGSTEEQIAEIAKAKIRRRNRSAGARALSAKYGKDAAERIIYRKTGKHVTLQQ